MNALFMRLFFWYELEADVNIVMKKKIKIRLSLCVNRYSVSANHSLVCVNQV